MLDYLVLSNKNPITGYDKDGNKVKYLDLLTPVSQDYENVVTDNYVTVSKEYVARPDLISLAAYGDDRFADVICKYNGISNPFEINIDDIILIPPLGALDTMFTATGKTSELIDEDIYSEKNTLFSKEHEFQKTKTEKRTPANSVIGEKNFVIDKSMGVVFY